MKTNNHFLSALLLVFCALFLSSCEKMFNKSPEIEDQSYTIKENSPNGTEIGQIVASDKSGQELTYRIVEGDDNEIFAVDKKTGMLSVNNSSLLNYESNEIVTIKVEAKDEFDKWDECEVTISLINLPEIDDSIFTIPENSKSGTLAGKIQTPDQNLTFNIITGNANDAFEISNDGSISVVKTELLDYEATSLFAFTVTAKNQQDYSDTAEITINLNDVEPTTYNLLSYYKFNGNGNDETGHSNATVTNGSYVADEAFSGNMVLSLNGNGYANLNKEFDYSSRSVSLWFKTSSVSTDQSVVFANDYENYQYGFTSMAMQNIDGLDNFLFNISGNPVLTLISENKWYNVVAVLDNNTYSYYINGNLVSSGINLSYVNSNLGYKNPLVGASRNFDRNFSGKIAEVRLYTKALSAEEARMIFLETGE